jgi:hypothetical protein
MSEWKMSKQIVFKGEKLNMEVTMSLWARIKTAWFILTGQKYSYNNIDLTLRREILDAIRAIPQAEIDLVDRPKDTGAVQIGT